MFKRLIILLLLLTTLTLSTPILTPRELKGEVTCETSPGSPAIADIQAVAKELNEDPLVNRCLQKVDAQDGCTVIAHVGETVVSLCGMRNRGVKCSDAAEKLLMLVEKCGWEGKAGGKFVTRGKELSLVVHK